MAPMKKKLTAGSMSKSGTGSMSKSVTGSMSKSGTGSMSKSSTGSMSKTGTSSINKSGSKLTSKSTTQTPKYSSGLSSNKPSAFGASSSKSYPSFATYKPKPSTGIGLLWIPIKKHNKHKKDVVYTGVNNAYPRGNYEKSPSMYGFGHMSGDSTDFQPHKKKEEETDLLMSDKAKAPVTTIAAAGAAIVSPEGPTDSNGNPEEKQEFIRRDKEETKEAAGDTKPTDFKDDKSDDYLDNDKVVNNSDKKDPNKEKYEDKVDSVYLRPPPPHKARSANSIVEEDGCGMKCLYYTLQCCDCVLHLIFFAINLTEPKTFPTNAKPWKSVRAFWSYIVRKEN